MNALLGITGILSRYAMLIDRENKDISPHTLNEVFLNKKWCVFDTLFNIIFEDEQGNKVSLQELSDKPDLIQLNILREYNREQADSIMASFFRMFPIIHQPRRSTPTLLQTHIFDNMTDIYFKIFKYKFFNSYQDLYLKFKISHLTSQDSKLFFMARNYHLSYRHNLALKYYDILLKEYSQSKYIEDVIFFCGILYFEIKDFAKSKEFFRLILNKYSQKWKDATNFYLEKIDTDFEKGEGI